LVRTSHTREASRAIALSKRTPLARFRAFRSVYWCKARGGRIRDSEAGRCGKTADTRFTRTSTAKRCRCVRAIRRLTAAIYAACFGTSDESTEDLRWGFGISIAIAFLIRAGRTSITSWAIFFGKRTSRARLRTSKTSFSAEARRCRIGDSKARRSSETAGSSSTRASTAKRCRCVQAIRRLTVAIYGAFLRSTSDKSAKDFRFWFAG